METTKKISPFVWFVRYLRESKEELRKVTWPSKQDTTKYTILILAIGIVIALFFAGLDGLLTTGLERLIALIS